MAQYGSLEKLGLAFVIALLFYIVKCIVNVVYTYIFGPIVNKVDFKSKGKWALVTGSTDGIGKEYAKETNGSITIPIAIRAAVTSFNISQFSLIFYHYPQLAARGCDIVLVSRSIDKLKATASEIENEYKVNTKIVQADFSEEGIYDKISKEIADLEIGTLVNNVGISYTYPEYFTEISDWESSISTMIKANMVSVTRMTGIVLPDMAKRGKGVIINIGSASSIIPSPLLTVYAASKAYVDKFTEGLDMEYGKKGIIIQCVQPGFVCSNMSGIRRATWMAPNAKTFVKSAINLVGTTPRTVGYFPHAIFVNSVCALYATFGRFTVWLVTRSMENTRRKAMKKYKKQ